MTEKSPTFFTVKETGDPEWLSAQFAGRWGQRIEIVYGKEKNILYLAD
jgi:hypothetical protein